MSSATALHSKDLTHETPSGHQLTPGNSPQGPAWMNITYPKISLVHQGPRYFR